MTRVVTIGESMGLAANDRPGTIASSRAHTLSFGGAESNFAIAMRRLGVEVTWVSRLGCDPVGDLIARELAAEGVAACISYDASRPTGFMLKQRRTQQSSSVTFWRSGSAASALSAEDVPASLIAGADLLHLTGILPGLSALGRECALAAAHAAKEANTLVSFDVNHRNRVWLDRDAASTYRQLIELADIVFAGVEEAALIVPSADPVEMASKLVALGPTQCVIKLGADGAYAFAEDRSWWQAAYAVEAVDTVGAGDAFVAGFLSAHLDGLSVSERLDRGARAGALACTVQGDWEGAPNLNELQSLFASERVAR